MIKKIINKNRSYRRFYEKFNVSRNIMEGLVNLARISPSAANLQPLKYIISNDPDRNDLVFGCVAWAGYLKEWPGPEKGERPAAYIIILGDREISASFGCDYGIAAQSILLGAVEKGLGGCIIGSIDREKLRNSLNISGRYEILLVVAIGKPKEKVLIEEIEPEGDIKYYRDKDGRHHVPKRKLKDIILD